MGRLEQFIDFTKNDNISKMPKKDLKEFFNLLNHYYLEYRDWIGVCDEYTFGIEIEAEFLGGKIHDEIVPFLREGWIQKVDDSLFDGDEYNSPPFMDTSKNWKELQEFCNILKKAYEIKDDCGGHIHIGANILGSNIKSWYRFLEMWATYENVIYRFSNGEFINPRMLYYYGKPISNDMFALSKKKKTFQQLIEEKILRDNGAVSFHKLESMEKRKDNTIEFRCPNGTLEPIIWQNNINFFMKFLLYCQSKNYNEELIYNRRVYNGDIYYINNYHKIYLNQALELVDLVFDNNLDKIYFLRQYTKNFQLHENILGLKKAKTFIKAS